MESDNDHCTRKIPSGGTTFRSVNMKKILSVWLPKQTRELKMADDNNDHATWALLFS